MDSKRELRSNLRHKFTWKKSFSQHVLMSLEAKIISPHKGLSASTIFRDILHYLFVFVDMYKDKEEGRGCGRIKMILS